MRSKEDFQLITPSVALTPYVKQYWFLTAVNAAGSEQRLIPAGCVALIFNRAEKVGKVADKNSLPHAYISGQVSDYSNLVLGNHFDMIMVVLQPAGARALFQIPVDKYNGLSLSVDLLDDPCWKELQQRLLETSDNLIAAQWIEHYLQQRLLDFESCHYQRMQEVFRLLQQGEHNINKLAEKACLGYKQFRRVFVEYVGLNPKEYLQVYRFNHAVRTLQRYPDHSLSQIAERCGYCDKSHLIRDIKKYSGYTPSTLQNHSHPYSEQLSLFQSFFIHTTKPI